MSIISDIPILSPPSVQVEEFQIRHSYDSNRNEVLCNYHANTYLMDSLLMLAVEGFRIDPIINTGSSNNLDVMKKCAAVLLKYITVKFPRNEVGMAY